MSKNYLFSSPENTLNASNSKNAFLNKHSFTIDEGDQIYRTAKLNKEAQNWSGSSVNNKLETSFDSILNDTPDFYYTSGHAQLNTDDNAFDPMFDFLPPFDDHLNLSHQQNTDTTSSSKATNIGNLNTNNNNQNLFNFDHETGNTEDTSIVNYFDGIQEPLTYNINEAKTSKESKSLQLSEKEINNLAKYSDLVDGTLSKMMQSDIKLKAEIRAYLIAENPIAAGEQTVIITTSKVAQKSYGTEKRFLCPPPTIIFVGSSWWKNPSPEESLRGDMTYCGEKYAPPLASISISGESSDEESGRIEWHSLSGAMVGQTGGPRSIVHIISKGKNTSAVSVKTKVSSNDNWYQNSKNEILGGGRCVLKRLFINDTDERRKRVECLVKIQLENGLMLGTLPSKPIKVISKPSKKRQSVKNMELCIYHGTTVSLFNRIRSQTVSTKYLGVSSSDIKSSVFEYPGRAQNQKKLLDDNTCFVAKTNCWDSFIIWIVNFKQSALNSEESSFSGTDAYIGCSSIVPAIPYPTPPTIATKNKTKQPLAIRYNQHIVLQCLTTGLVSPVMIVRKVDKASTVVGGARCPKEFNASFSGGGEYGDEVLGDPVSQLHKIALQIVPQNNDAPDYNKQSHSQQQQTHGFSNINMPPQIRTSINNHSTEKLYHGDDKRSSIMMPQMTAGPVTYLACLNDIVGTHNTTTKRRPIKGENYDINPIAAAAAAESFTFTASALSATLNSTHPIPPLNKRQRVAISKDQSDFDGTTRCASNLNYAQSRYLSTFSINQQTSFRSNINGNLQTSHDNSLHTKPHVSKNNESPNNGQALAELGAYWSEKLTDSAVWTIVGTECAKYTFWVPPQYEKEKQVAALTSTYFPRITHFTLSNEHYGNPGSKKNTETTDSLTYTMTISGKYFTRDLQVWFGDVKAPITEYKNNEMLLCHLPAPEELMQSGGLNRVDDADVQSDEEARNQKLQFGIGILLVREDGIVYKTNKTFYFC